MTPLLMTFILTVLLAPIQGNDQRDVLFVSSRDGEEEIYVMRPDGSDVRQLTHTVGDKLSNNPAWSWDGTKIAFLSNRDFGEAAPWGQDAELYVMDADGSNVQRVTSNEVFDSAPKWSPDGITIAFFSVRDGNWDVYLIDADGTNERQVTDHPGRDLCPSWSPDGARLTFASNRADGEHFELYTADLASGDVQRLTHTSAGVAPCSSWSPNGQWIAFQAYHNGGMEIFVMRSDGSEARQLTDTPGAGRWCGAATWSPDGLRIAFHSNRDGVGGQADMNDLEIYVVEADGSSLHRLTENEVYDGHPAW